MGAPGCPERAFCTESIARKRRVLMHNWSRAVSVNAIPCSSGQGRHPGAAYNCRLYPQKGSSGKILWPRVWYPIVANLSSVAPLKYRAFSKSGRHSRAGGNPASPLPIPLDSRFRGSDDFSSPTTLDDNLKRPCTGIFGCQVLFRGYPSQLWAAFPLRHWGRHRPGPLWRLPVAARAGASRPGWP